MARGQQCAAPAGRWSSHLCRLPTLPPARPAQARPVRRYPSTWVCARRHSRVGVRRRFPELAARPVASPPAACVVIPHRQRRSLWPGAPAWGCQHRARCTRTTAARGRGSRLVPAQPPRLTPAARTRARAVMTHRRRPQHTAHAMGVSWQAGATGSNGGRTYGGGRVDLGEHDRIGARLSRRSNVSETPPDRHNKSATTVPSPSHDERGCTHAARATQKHTSVVMSPLTASSAG